MKAPRVPPRARTALIITAVVAITIGATAANVALLDEADEVNAPLGELRQTGLNVPAAGATGDGAVPGATTAPVIPVPTRTDDDDDDDHGDHRGEDHEDDDDDD